MLLNIARSTKDDKGVHPHIKFEENYDARLMPSIHKLPLDVNLTVNIKNIYGLNEVEQLLKMESTVQLNWVDERVQFKNDTSSEFWTLPPWVSHNICCSTKYILSVLFHYIEYFTSIMTHALTYCFRQQNTFGFLMCLLTGQNESMLRHIT